MSWLNRMRDRISSTLERIKERIRSTLPDREEERRVIHEEERVEEERYKITVYEKEPAELRPFSSLFQWSAKTKTYRERGTGRFVDKLRYQQELAFHRFAMAHQYIQMTHPQWTGEEIVAAIERVEELRAKPELTAMDEIEIGEIFTPP